MLRHHMAKEHRTYECEETSSGKSCKKVSSTPASKKTVTFKEK